MFRLQRVGSHDIIVSKIKTTKGHEERELCGPEVK